MALTNLTFGDGANKALLCSFRQFMKALVAQLKSPSEDLRQVIVNRNRNIKTILMERLYNKDEIVSLIKTFYVYIKSFRQ